MKKILVTTDFSPASKSAVLFAIQWSTQQKLELIFIYVLHIVKPTNWDKTILQEHVRKKKAEANARLKTFIENIYKQLNIAAPKISTKIIEGISADICILHHVSKNRIYDGICISTRGAGGFKKILGTTTGNLITKSSIPVLAVPANYKVKKISDILFATDMKNFKEEAKKVIEFAKPLKAKIEMIHFAWPNEVLFDEDFILLPFKKHFRYGLEFYYEKNDAVHSLIERLEEKIKKNKPSVMVMFTNRKRTFFQRLFLSSKSEELSFRTTVPLLVFNKNV